MALRNMFQMSLNKMNLNFAFECEKKTIFIMLIKCEFILSIYIYSIAKLKWQTKEKPKTDIQNFRY